jgi:hypothetical protein
VSAIGVACIAVVVAGAVWYERWCVRRSALRRGHVRRASRVGGFDLGGAPDGGSSRLAVAIEHAVFAGDLAASYEARWREESKRGESPFQLKRGRMEASTLAFTRALDQVEAHATTWLVAPAIECRQRQHAVVRLVDHLAARPRDGALSDLTRLDATIDLLENALANLCSPHGAATRDPHPFR